MAGSILEYREQALEQEPRTYSSQHLSEKLAKELQVQLSADRIQQLLKKGWRWKRTRHSHRHNQDSVAKALKQPMSRISRTSLASEVACVGTCSYGSLDLA